MKSVKINICTTVCALIGDLQKSSRMKFRNTQNNTTGNTATFFASNVLWIDFDSIHARPCSTHQKTLARLLICCISTHEKTFAWPKSPKQIFLFDPWKGHTQTAKNKLFQLLICFKLSITWITIENCLLPWKLRTWHKIPMTQNFYSTQENTFPRL